jgi:hypothetical protein
MESPVTIDERELREQLSTALDGFTPGPVPYASLVQRGRKVAIRRRLSVIAGVAVLAAAAAVTPSIIGQLRPSAPASYHVTVSPPRPGSPRGLIASGRVNGLRWQVTGQVSGTGLGLLVTFRYREASYPVRSGESGGDLLGVAVASFINGTGSPGYIGVASVASDVTYLTAVLSNGQHLTLVPQAIGPHAPRLVALAVPASADVTELIAYSARAEVGRAFPYTAAGAVQLGRWLRPGQPVPPGPATYVIGHGSVAGRAWTVRLYQGPWGTCYGTASAAVSPECLNVSPGQDAGGGVVGPYLEDLGGPSASTELEIGVAEPQVRQLQVTLPGRRPLSVPLASRDGYRFFVFPVRFTGRTHWVRWVAFGAASRRLGSGQWPLI